MSQYDPTTDPQLRSFIEVPATSHFPIQNLPYGVFRLKSGGSAHIGVAIGNKVLNVSLLDAEGHLSRAALTGKGLFDGQHSLNRFMAAGRTAWRQAREQISTLLRHDTPTLRDTPRLYEAALIPLTDVELLMPVTIGDYTDFYASKHHATNVGSMFRDKDNALLPNWTWLPVGYHGRASSVIPSGTPVLRPSGQHKADDADAPAFGPCRLLDFELEMGFFTGPGNALGQPIPIDRTDAHIFGMVIVNDWSARDIQKWEYVPLGPFLSKSFATSISPWVVTMDALAPYRCPGPEQIPEPLPYLHRPGNGAFDIQLEVHLQSEAMTAPARICQSNLKYMYWNVYQQLAHHTVNGCNVRPGDMMASGTISGPTPDSYGSMLELAWRGTRPLRVSETEQRSFIHDGDTISMTGWCQGDGYRVGFGEVTGKVLPAL